MKIIQNSREMQQASRLIRAGGGRIVLVPTMGFLHEGHLRLVDEAKRHGDQVVLSVFVNPTQFGPQEDFSQYPRDVERDKQLARERGVGIFFLPAAEDIYPPGDQTWVVVTELSRGLCGPFRPGHFRGVSTVVAKLFSIVQPDAAVFGEKDYQQLAVIKRMVQDLHLPVEIIGVPTVREVDGLALSSRNAYLDPAEKQEALHLFQAWRKAQEILKGGEKNTAKILESVRAVLGAGPHTALEYAEIVDAETLESLKTVDRSARLVMAVRINGKRLIDNGPLLP
jgi:pantoate--beta-alanine ligase